MNLKLHKIVYEYSINRDEVIAIHEFLPDPDGELMSEVDVAWVKQTNRYTSTEWESLLYKLRGTGVILTRAIDELTP